MLPVSGFLMSLPAVDINQIYGDGKDILSQSIRLFCIAVFLGIPISYWVEKGIRGLNGNK